MQLKVYVDGSNQIETGTILQKVLRIMEKAKVKKNLMMLQIVQLTHKTDSQFREMMMNMIDMVADEALVVALHRAQGQLRDERQGAKKHQMEIELL